MNKKICFYHAVDLDGKCSGAIFRFVHERILDHRSEDVELIPFNYGDDLDLNKVADCDVYFVDCNPQPLEKWLEPLTSKASSVTIIDHHKSLLEDPVYLKAVEEGKIFSYSRIGIGACALVWEYFFDVLKVEHLVQMPETILLLAKYDAWCDEDKEEWDNQILPFQYGVRLVKLNPIKDFDKWVSLFSDKNITKHIERGKAILTYEKNRLAGRCKSAAFEAVINGRKAICINSDSKSSMTLESVFDPEKHEVMCVYNHSFNVVKNRLEYSISFYSTREDVDCSLLAKELGGGGHKGAAGCMATSLTFDGKELILT